MQYDVVIIGTCHTYQAGGKDCAVEDAELLRNFLLNACQEWRLSGIAEEMDSEWLVRYESRQSVPSRVAAELGLSYCDCDPNSAERVRAGIIGSGEVRLEAELKGFSEDEIAKRLAAEEVKREQYWLRRLQHKDVWPTLFVCGANHVMRFKSLLVANELATHVLVEDWEPNVFS